MLRGLYITMNSLDVQQAKLNNISNNLANLATPGYKKSNLLDNRFAESLQLALEANGPGGKRQPVGEGNLGNLVTQVQIDWQPGPLTETGQATDLALEGKGFFVVENDNGEQLYTRNGSFVIDAEGNLRTVEGYLVLGEGGPITVEDREHLVVREDGTIMTGAGREAEAVDKLQLVEFPDTARLQKADGNYFTDPDGTAEPAAATTVVQGWLEKSNVDPVQAMIDIIPVARIYEAGQKLVQVNDDLLDKAINQVARVK
ncbi:flagellar basal-body rod protein FlgF [Desulforamulus hydrothermalis]|uniref:Putative flagellar basal-body rod protein flgG n=1 Tax=Desulforamulus hydrothermalis Lam5 = DSM 18033 TaxID=1121428 RepID=K8E0U7_9FIRM|nr:flagellar basal-body rod protein FlgF [Desulforamulus hydrothermalis]CCO09185.1 putative flagellar basal-body rod protein flgG [Desulforamulus hydrothermalis Lam5 = DSM 18033]SHH11080.1 flagellar basal-body rod protein FlgG [Desulforamulus hydrothermalis Lam5 = DSM 18033]